MSNGTEGRLRYMDCNCQIGPFEEMEAAYFTSLDDLLAEMEYLGIESALVMHTWASRWSPAKGNEKIDAALADHDHLYPCYVGLPPATGELPEPGDFAQTVRSNHGAVRLFPSDHQFNFTPWCIGDLLAALQDASIPVLIDIKHTSWDEISDVLAQFPDLPLVILDLYYRVNRHIYPLLEKHPNLHIETHTYQIPFGIEDVSRRFGAEHLLFGTNLPVNEGGGALAQIEYSKLSDQDRQLIAADNLKRLLGISE